MKKKAQLSNILKGYKLDYLTLEEAENKILLLFSLSGRLCPCGETNDTSECDCPITDFFNM